VLSEIVNCFHQYSCEDELNKEADLDTSIEEEDAFLEGWIQLGAEKDVSFTSYISVISELATCTFSSPLSCVITMKVAGAVQKRKRVTDMTLNQCQALLKCMLLAKLLSNYFMCIALACVMNRTF
jgi:hypothetical protein